MKVKQLPLEQAVGHILLHNQAGPDGRKVLKKGHRLTTADVPLLRSIDREQVYVAILDHDDIDENEAARRLGATLTQATIAVSRATTGRVNLISQTNGLFKVNVAALVEFNECPGITLGTIPNNSQVQSRTMLGTIKIIPYAIPGPALATAEAIVHGLVEQPLVDVKPFVIRQAVLITTGSEVARHKVIEAFSPPLKDRLASYDTTLIEGPYVAEEKAEISQALQWALDNGAEMILMAGETSIMDVDDITPRAICAIGGEIVHHGVPVEPGNLFLLAYYGDIPIVGAPGCARSRSYNVVDMVLPRLAAGERLTKHDLIELGHGGLLKKG